MKGLNTLTIVIFGAGIVLLYSGLKDKNPKDVITLSISGKSPSTAASGGSTPATAPTVTALHPATPTKQGRVTNV